MRIAVLGGGPAGLYFAYLWRKRHPDSHIVLFEQNPADATWGFGVVFSERALDFLRADDPDTADSFAPHMETWQGRHPSASRRAHRHRRGGLFRGRTSGSPIASPALRTLGRRDAALQYDGARPG
jgi:2-polyprenyl-6-methoxyphenol hydroxylase-like FAD-dependent oxidoreductase